jgi:BirA family biotin operon repressor/biotin-[acetyl-CoA-carboxylase] ligase
LLYFASVGSTNDIAAALAERGGAEGAVIVAETQSAGRGRRGRVWFSPPGSGLYVSIVLAPSRARLDPDRAVALLPLAAGVALADAIEAAAGLKVELKWPNDLYVGRRKLGGILAEAVALEGPRAAAPGAREPGGPSGGSPSEVTSVVCGYGINVASVACPRDIADRATSLEAELGRPIGRAELLVETLTAMACRYEELLLGRYDAILDAWRARAPRSVGARVSWTTGTGTDAGVTAGVDERGALLVRIGHRTERIVGEVNWL